MGEGESQSKGRRAGVRVSTSDLQVDVIVPMCEQRLRQLAQVGLQQGGGVVGVEAARLQVDLCPRI